MGTETYPPPLDARQQGAQYQMLPSLSTQSSRCKGAYLAAVTEATGRARLMTGADAAAALAPVAKAVAAGRPLFLLASGCAASAVVAGAPGLAAAEAERAEDLQRADGVGSVRLVEVPRGWQVTLLLVLRRGRERVARAPESCMSKMLLGCIRGCFWCVCNGSIASSSVWCGEEVIMHAPNEHAGQAETAGHAQCWCRRSR